MILYDYVHDIIFIMHFLCIIVNNAFFSFTHTEDLTLNSNVTCDLLSIGSSCINIIRLMLLSTAMVTQSSVQELTLGALGFEYSVAMLSSRTVMLNNSSSASTMTPFQQVPQLSQVLSLTMTLGLINLEDPSHSRTYWPRTTN